MATYRFKTTSPNLDSASRGLVDWFQAQQFTVESSGGGDARVVRAKKTGGLRTMTGTGLSFIVALSSQSDGQCACEITTDHGASNVAGAATTALFTGGVTLLTAGIGLAESSKMEERIVLHLEQLLGTTRLAPPPQATPSSAAVANRQPTPPVATHQAATSVPKPLPSKPESATTDTITSDAVVDGLAKAGGFLWSTAKAIGKGVVWLVSYKCPKCNEADYKQKEIGVHYDKHVGTAYRGLNGQLRKNWSQGSTQVQVLYLRKTTTYELTCKKCGNVWNERSKEEVIA